MALYTGFYKVISLLHARPIGFVNFFSDPSPVGLVNEVEALVSIFASIYKTTIN